LSISMNASAPSSIVIERSMRSVESLVAAIWGLLEFQLAVEFG
jgi:hypothetical protein